MRKRTEPWDYCSVYFLIGAVCGTALACAGRFSEKRLLFDASLARMLLRTLAPFLFAYFLKSGDTALSSTVPLFLRGFSITLVISLLLRTKNQTIAMAYLASQIFLLPAFVLWTAPRERNFYDRANHVAGLRCVAVILFWYIGTFLRCSIFELVR